MLEKYYLTTKGKAELERMSATGDPKQIKILLALDSRTEYEEEADPYTLSKLLQQGYIGKMEEF